MSVPLSSRPPTDFRQQSPEVLDDLLIDLAGVGDCLGEPVGVVNAEHARWQDAGQRSRSQQLAELPPRHRHARSFRHAVSEAHSALDIASLENIPTDGGLFTRGSRSEVL